MATPTPLRSTALLRGRWFKVDALVPPRSQRALLFCLCLWNSATVCGLLRPSTPLCDTLSRCGRCSRQDLRCPVVLSVCLALLRGDQPRMHLNSARSRLPRAPVSTSLRWCIPTSAEWCETSMSHLRCGIPTSAEYCGTSLTRSCNAPTSAEFFEASPPLLPGLHELAACCTSELSSSLISSTSLA